MTMGEYWLRQNANSTGLAGAVTRDNRFRRLQQDLQVKQEGTLTYVAKIEPHHLVELYPTASVHLPKPGDSWLGFEDAPAMPGVVGFDFVG